jgi:hypothetical protein
MRNLPKLCAVASVLLASGCGSASTKSTPPATVSKPVTATPVAFLPSTCGNQVERPNSFLIACADGGSGVEHIVWRGWGDPVAVGTGFAFANDCEPTYAVLVTTNESSADRTAGAYRIGCAGHGSSGVSRTEPEPEEPAP